MAGMAQLLELVSEGLEEEVVEHGRSAIQN